MQKIRLLKMLICSFSFILVLVSFFLFAHPYRISGDCMEPAIRDGGLYFLNRVSGYFPGYRAGDIILFKHEGKTWISRIVALGNDTIQINEQSIKVNGIILQDKVHRNWTDWNYGTYAIDTVTKIPSNHAYVLSDNLSAHHDDSRVFGPISYSLILGAIW